MEKIGMYKRTLEQALWRGSKSFIVIKDPEDKRRILVEYDSLKPSLKEKAQLWLGECPHTYYRKSWIKSYITPDAYARRFFTTHQVYGQHLSIEDQESYYTAVLWLNMIAKLSKSKSLLKANNCTVTQFWDTVCTMIDKEGIRLPSNYSRLSKKIRDYGIKNYATVIKSHNFSSSNATKINDEVADWLVAQYSLPNKPNIEYILHHYNIEATAKGWKAIKDASTIYKFLYRKDVVQLWFGARHGHREADERYGYTLRTKLPTLRDALWYSDGTKLNFFDSTGKLKASYMVYEVMDVYSEVFLGYHISKSEDHIAQYHSYKMAFQTSGFKPHETRTDNQSGHKKIGSFMDKLAHHNIRTQAYNGKSKTIESAFGRFQQGFMSELWFYTGQNITAKKLDSRANMEFIIANIMHLPTQDQIKQIYAEYRSKWNNAKHPKADKTRFELYLNSYNPKTEKVDYLDMVELFWLDSPKPITYYNHGITIEIGKTKYEYEILKEGMPDSEFRRQYIGQKFIVKHDPDNMDHVRLYLQTDKGLQFVTIAEPRLVVPRAMQDYQPGDAQMIRSLLGVRADENKQRRLQTRDREERTGIRAKDLLNQIDSLGKYQKQLSNQDWDDELLSGDSPPGRQSALNRI
ncbi:MAG: hypothetical protein M9958_00385 [Chitinophagales bacterium]|nr:hypothetical protein [Chitinophagales bacterium]